MRHGRTMIGSALFRRKASRSNSPSHRKLDKSAAVLAGLHLGGERRLVLSKNAQVDVMPAVAEVTSAVIGAGCSRQVPERGEILLRVESGVKKLISKSFFVPIRGDARAGVDAKRPLSRPAHIRAVFVCDEKSAHH